MKKEADKLDQLREMARERLAREPGPFVINDQKQVMLRDKQLYELVKAEEQKAERESEQEFMARNKHLN